MARWRTPDLRRLFFGQHIVNGVSVAAGVMAVALIGSTVFGFAAGQPATLGAIAASISDVPAPWRDKARAMLFGFAFALLSTTAIQLALALPRFVAAWFAIAAVAFAAGMVSGLGRWALAIAMEMIVAMVFVLGLPRPDVPKALHNEALLAAGGFAYIAFSLVATLVTGPSARRLVAGETIREFASYLRAVTAIYDPDNVLAAAYGAAIRQQAALAEQLQSARALLLDRPHSTPERLRLAATIAVLLEAFDALVAAQCEVALVREISAAAALLKRIRASLRVGALDLDHLSVELLTTGNPILPPDHQLAIDAVKQEMERLQEDEAIPPMPRSALVATCSRILLALGQIRRLETTLSDDKAAEKELGGVALGPFIPKRSYDLRALGAHFQIESPVLRFAVRLALAMMAGALVARSLGSEQHGNWVLLTIAVVLRANYGLTRQRRDDRVIGTLVGCVAAAGFVAYLPLGALVAVQGSSIALLQSFVRLDYRIASIGASVSALVSLHLAQPDLPAPILARLADTLIGAAIAHAFSFVWPRWEFLEAPRIASRLQDRLSVFAGVALRPEASNLEYRMARKNMIEALAALSDSAGRMSIEPTATRKGLDEMAALLMAAHGLVAQLSAARLDARAGRPATDDATRDWLQARLAPKAAGSAPIGPAPPGPLGAAALAVVDAGQRYEEAARNDVIGA